MRTTGRRSGQQRSTPLGVVQVEGGLYLVSPTAPLTETPIPNTVDVDGAQPAWQPK